MVHSYCPPYLKKANKNIPKSYNYFFHEKSPFPLTILISHIIVLHVCRWFPGASLCVLLFACKAHCKYKTGDCALGKWQMLLPTK